MNDEDDEEIVVSGLVDLSMRGWRTLEDVKLDSSARRVQLEQNSLVALPSSIGNLSLMTHLDASQNALESLPAELGTCLRLRYLNCSHNSLDEMPSELARCRYLEEIVAHHNLLRTLPEGLGTLDMLRVINVRHNRLETLPYDLGAIDTLEDFDCSENEHLLEFPEKIRDEPDLVRFVLKLRYQLESQKKDLEQDYEKAQAELMETEEANLRLREAIELAQAEKSKTLASMVRSC